MSMIVSGYSNSASISTSSMNIAGLTALSAPDEIVLADGSRRAEKLVIGQRGVPIEIAGDLIMLQQSCVLCHDKSPYGFFVQGEKSRVHFCMKCAAMHLKGHEDVQLMIKQIDVKDKFEEPTK